MRSKVRGFYGTLPAWKRDQKVKTKEMWNVDIERKIVNYC